MATNAILPASVPKEWSLQGERRWRRTPWPPLPHAHGREATREILDHVARSGEASFLAVLKTFGAVESPGMLSFPRPGITLALDFPNRGERTQRLFRTLDGLVREAEGRLYPAKDACMTAEDFQRAYPEWGAFQEHIDPAFSSSFWRRVTGD